MLHSHLLAISDDWITCSCDDHFSRFTGTTFEWHVADAVIEALKLREEVIDGAVVKDWVGTPIRIRPPRHRYVTEWETTGE